MENASKALIIAGAILLAILIISLGIMIYNQAAGVANGDAINQVDISSFNTQFTQYSGNNVRGAQVNALLEQVRNSNITYQDDTSRQVNITASGWTGTAPSGTLIGGTYTKAQTGTTYKVECTPDSTTGYITKITITANAKS